MLDWTHSLNEIGADGVSGERDATPTERASVAAALGLPEVGRLHARYKLRPLSSGRYRLSGALSADVTQTCVVSLGPAPAKIDESFDVEFWPSEALPEPEGGEVDVLTATDIEPIEGGGIALGRVVFETLAAGLDPYPRAPGAVFELGEQNASEHLASGPFAKLAKFKKGGSAD